MCSAERVRAQPIGLLGGTFDPVHIGHLRLAIEIAEHFSLSELRLLPAATPNLRAAPLVDAGDRLAMLQAALVDLPQLCIDTREIDRGGVSYTVDTLASLRGELAAHCLLFAMGMDAFAGLTGWHRWRELLDYANLVIVTRPGRANRFDDELSAVVQTAQCENRQDFITARNGRIFFQSIPLLPISSTDIRNRIRRGLSIRCLVPDRVADIIAKRNYYKTECP